MVLLEADFVASTALDMVMVVEWRWGEERRRRGCLRAYGGVNQETLEGFGVGVCW